MKGDKSTEMKKLLGLMQLGAKQGDELSIRIEGEDEEAAAAAIEAFLKANL